MKKSKRIALSGMLSALALVFMLLAYFPYLTFSLPALAGGLFLIVMIEINPKWAFGSFVSTAILALIMCEKEAAVLFVAFFGYYPIVKGYLEKCRNRIIEYIVKFLTFNCAIIMAYLVIIFVFNLPIENMDEWGKYGLYMLLALGNIVFFVYDLALSVAYQEYMAKLHIKVKSILR